MTARPTNPIFSSTPTAQSSVEYRRDIGPSPRARPRPRSRRRRRHRHQLHLVKAPTKFLGHQDREQKYVRAPSWHKYHVHIPCCTVLTVLTVLTVQYCTVPQNLLKKDRRRFAQLKSAHVVGHSTPPSTARHVPCLRSFFTEANSKMRVRSHTRSMPHPTTTMPA